MSSSTRTSDGWIPLLQWDSERAAKLPDVVERIQLEPHPVSGEIELDDVRPAKYRRLDEETLHSRLEVEQFELLPIFVWCQNDEHGETGPGWKLAELRALEDVDDGTEWYDSIIEANEAQNRAVHSRSMHVPTQSDSNADSLIPAGQEEEEDEEDDGSYWAAYDRTPGRTPAQKRSPAPLAPAAGSRPRTQSELEYFSRYADVQPAMDGHDPDEVMPEMSESSLNGHALHFPPPSQSQQASLYPADPPKAHDSAMATALTRSLNGGDELSAPRPISPTSSHGSVDRLEERAAAISTADRAMVGVKQHISTDIKSLFRLARSAGMEREEFEEQVRRELSVLSLLEQDD